MNWYFYQYNHHNRGEEAKVASITISFKRPDNLKRLRNIVMRTVNQLSAGQRKDLPNESWSLRLKTKTSKNGCLNKE